MLPILFAVAALAQPDPKALVTKVYDLTPFLGEKGRAGGFADADAVVKMILDVIPFGELKPGTDGPQLVERDGGKLEVRTTAKLHAEVADLIEALARLADVAIDLKVEVVELDAAAFAKLPKAKAGSPVLLAVGAEIEDGKAAPAAEKAFAEATKVLKAGRVVQTSEARIANGVEATLSARQSVLTFHPNVVGKKPHGPPEFVKEGFKFVGVPVVSADRRFVRFKLTEQSVAVAGVRKREIAGLPGGQTMVAISPDLEDLGSTGSAVTADGGAVLFRLAYAPKDRVWVVVLRPTIFIPSEEAARKPGK